MIFRAAFGSGLSPALAACQSCFGRLDRRAVDLARRDDARARVVVVLLDREPADRDAAHPLLLRAASASGSVGAPVRQLEDERAQLLARHAALDRDLLDLALAHVAREADQRGGRLRQPLAR